MELVDGQTQFAQVDVEVDHHVPRHGRREHFLGVEEDNSTLLRDQDELCCCCDVRTIRPLVASSGSVMEAGVVRRFRARVSCSITASMSYGSSRNTAVTSHHAPNAGRGTVSGGDRPCSPLRPS